MATGDGLLRMLARVHRGAPGRIPSQRRYIFAHMAEQVHALDPVDFSTHALSLASTALVALGRMPGPDGESHPLDLETARHLIDVLAMLEQKTKGNLDEAEQKLLASLIYDLRVAYVDAQNAKHG
ncbi:MAG TPA: DUF1844 domain-containing protein [Kofleriaceae bacterium]|nr:DUF1844 domain-containing protein [Kofleriaceae bacterium]